MGIVYPDFKKIEKRAETEIDILFTHLEFSHASWSEIISNWVELWILKSMTIKS